MKFTMIDWNIILNTLIDGEEVTTDPVRWNLSNPEYKKIYDRWEQANFNMSAVKWVNYYPSKHFDQNVVDEISRSLNVKTHRAWISKIDPGYCAPYHWDIDDNEHLYLQQGKIDRFTIIMQENKFGHIFILDKDYFYNLPINTVLHWKTYKDWHAAANIGFEPYYMFHVVAKKLDEFSNF